MTLVGAGPGDPDLLTVKALRALQDADVVFYDELVSPEILDRARRDASRVPVGRRVGKPGIGQDAINRLLIEAAKSGQRAVRLKGGDPFVFGRGGEEIEALRAGRRRLFGDSRHHRRPRRCRAVRGAADLPPRGAAHHLPHRAQGQGRRSRRLVGPDGREDDDRRLYGHDRGAFGARRPAGRRTFAADAGRRVRAGDAAGRAGRCRNARWIARSGRKDRRRSRHSHHRRRGRALRALARIRTSLNSSRIIRKPPNDLSARTEENQDHRSVDGHRQPHLGWRRDLPHRLARAGRPTCPMPRSSAPRTRRARCSPNRWPTMSARSAPISRRSKSRKAARSSPAICANISARRVSPSILPVPA